MNLIGLAPHVKNQVILLTPIEITAIIGAITGSVSLTIIIYKVMQEKPKLSFEDKRKFFFQPDENSSFTTILVELKVHNKGSKSTTIHNIDLTFKYKDEEKTIAGEGIFTILADSTQQVSPRLNLHKDDLRIYDQIQNCVLKIYHTHGKTDFNLGTIKDIKH